MDTTNSQMLTTRAGEGTKQRDYCYDFIRFVATVLVVLSHLYSTASDNKYYNLPFMPLKLTMGGGYGLGRIGVILFCMLSGALLIKRYNDNFNAKQFFKKRFLRIYIPHCIAYLFVFTYYMIMRPTYFKQNWLYGVLFSFLGLDFFDSPYYTHFSKYGVRSYWLVGEWFTTVILILYLLFPLLRLLFKKCKIFGTILITVIFVLNLEYKILSYHNGWFSLTNCIMSFWLGMLIEPIKHKFKGAETVICLLFCIIIATLKPKTILGYAYLAPFLFSVMLFILLTRCNVNTKFTAYICKYNYEIYLVHHRVFILVLPYILSKMKTFPTQIMMMIIMFWVICKLSEYLQILTNKLIDRINSTEFKKINFPKIKLKTKEKLE